MQLRYFNQPHFENGSLKLISQVLKENGISKPLICTDPGLVKIGMTDKIRSLISNELSPTFYTETCLLYTSPSPRDPKTSRMPSSA